MDERFGYCTDCKKKDCCKRCYRGSHYESNNNNSSNN